MCYYALGSLCLPNEDFSLLSYLPGMYHHCRTTEDKDMDAIGFIIGHLMNFDNIFGKLDHNQENERPHLPIAFHQIVHQPSTTVNHISFSVNNYFVQIGVAKPNTENFILIGYSTKIFHPPVI